MTMIHHVSVGTNDIKRARAFYEPLMSLIGFRILKSSDKAVHFGSSDIMFSLETPINGLLATPGNGVHIAFQAPDRQTVRRFHETPSRMVRLTRERPAFVKITTPTIMAPLSEIRMETRLRPLPTRQGKRSNDGDHISKFHAKDSNHRSSNGTLPSQNRHKRLFTLSPRNRNLYSCVGHSLRVRLFSFEHF